MAGIRAKTPTEKIFENIMFLAEVFGDQADKDIPKWPVLEMAQCFELDIPTPVQQGRRRSKAWRLWK